MLLDLPDIRQSSDFDCGAATTNCVFTYLGYNKPRKFFLQMLGTNEMNGTDPRTLEAQIRREGYKVLSGDMAIEDLRSQANQGRPVILLVTLHGGGHYITSRGVQRGRVHYQDPSCGPQSMKVNEFKERWNDYDRFGITYANFGIAVWN